jgi:hypothetical protein
MTTLKYTNASAASAEVNRRAEAHMSEHQGVSYKEALHAVLASDRELRDAYAQPAARVTAKPLRPRPPAPAPVQMAQGDPAGCEVHRRAVSLTEKHPSLGYGAAVKQVLDEDPALKASYARS